MQLVDDGLMAEIRAVLRSVPFMLQTAKALGYSDERSPSWSAEYDRLQTLEDRWWALVVRLGLASAGDWVLLRLTVPSEPETTDPTPD